MSHGAGCRCEEEASSDAGAASSLHEYIDFVECCGVDELDGEVRRLLRAPSERFDQSVCVSTFDDEVLLLIGFTNPVAVHSIVLLCDEGHWAQELRVFKDQPDTDLDQARDLKPIQTLPVLQDPCGLMDHPLKINRFQNTTTLQLLLTGPQMTLRFVGLKGVPTNHRREAVRTVYESRPNIADHAVGEKAAPLADT